LKTADGHQRVVRHGHLPEREVMTGIGPVAVRQPRVGDREADVTCPDRIRFSPSILPPYMRRSKSIETLLPMLYLKGISTGDFSEALAALLGKDAAGLSASAIGRLKDGWLDDDGRQAMPRLAFPDREAGARRGNGETLTRGAAAAQARRGLLVGGGARRPAGRAAAGAAARPAARGDQSRDAPGVVPSVRADR
jgi:Transposase, Mutator family